LGDSRAAARHGDDQPAENRGKRGEDQYEDRSPEGPDRHRQTHHAQQRIQHALRHRIAEEAGGGGEHR
jgi:hypothetical protein